MNGMKISVGLLLLSACEQKEDEQNQDTSVVESCSDVSPSECGSTDGCFVLTGSPVGWNSSNECIAWANTVEQVGCMSTEFDCGAMISYAAPPEDPSNCYGFSNTCYPEAWVSCDLPGNNMCQE